MGWSEKRFWKLYAEADARQRQRPKVEKHDRPKFAESTLVATRWLMKFHPERLPEWFDRHEEGLREAARNAKVDG